MSALAQRLCDNDASVRQAAALALREMGPAAKDAIPSLALALQDHDRYVAVDAALTVEKMGPEAMPAVVALLRHRDPRVRELALLTLQHIAADSVPSGLATGR